MAVKKHIQYFCCGRVLSPKSGSNSVTCPGCGTTYSGANSRIKAKKTSYKKVPYKQSLKTFREVWREIQALVILLLLLWNWMMIKANDVDWGVVLFTIALIAVTAMGWKKGGRNVR